MIQAIETLQTIAAAAPSLVPTGELEPCLTNTQEYGNGFINAAIFTGITAVGSAALSSWWFSRNPRRYPVSMIERTKDDRNRRIRVVATSTALSAITAASIVYEPLVQSCYTP